MSTQEHRFWLTMEECEMFHYMALSVTHRCMVYYSKISAHAALRDKLHVFDNQARTLESHISLHEMLETLLLSNSGESKDKMVEIVLDSELYEICTATVNSPDLHPNGHMQGVSEVFDGEVPKDYASLFWDIRRAILAGNKEIEEEPTQEVVSDDWGINTRYAGEC
jgi:hypothetical protein